MEVTEKYKDLQERAEKIALREGQGLRILHDNFDPDWKVGKEPHGTLTFTDEPAKQSIVEPVRDYGDEIDEIKAKIADYDELKAKVEALEEK